MVQLSRVVLIVSILSSLIACKSKFAESSPAQVSVGGISLQERVSQKIKIDAKINEIQGLADRIKAILDLARKIQSPDQNQNVYTPFDFLIDVGSELKKELPGGNEKQILKFSRFEIPVQQISEDCKIIQTKLESSAIYNEDGTEKTGEKLTYSIHTCKMAKNEFKSIFEASWIGSNLSFNLENDVINEALGVDLLSEESILPANCHITKDDSKSIQSFQCKEVYFKISKTENAILRKFEFNQSAALRIESLIDIFENSKMKSKIHVWQKQDGDLEYEIKKTEMLK
jgi:hypothetical protein